MKSFQVVFAVLIGYVILGLFLAKKDSQFTQEQNITQEWDKYNPYGTWLKRLYPWMPG